MIRPCSSVSEAVSILMQDPAALSYSTCHALRMKPGAPSTLVSIPAVEKYEMDSGAKFSTRDSTKLIVY